MAELRRLGPGDEAEVQRASALFDGPAREDATRHVLRAPGHHLVLAHEDGEPVGFVSGVELTHPDKGTEMLLYELSVAEPFRRRGMGRALVRALAAIARERGCYDLFVLTAATNAAALATYAADDPVREDGWVMVTWDTT